MPSGLVSICVKVDLNKKQVSARYNILHFILRLHKELACYFVGKDGNWTKTEEDLSPLVEKESILSISAQQSTFAQNE